MPDVVVTFEDWLATHRNRASRLGDLARDVSVDVNWPTGAGIESYRFYIQRSTAYETSLRALNEAWKAYRAYMRRAAAP